MHLTVDQTQILYIALIICACALVGLSSANSVARFKLHFKNKSVSAISFVLLSLSYFLLLIPLAIRNCGVDTPQYYRTYVSDDTVGLDTTFYYLCKFMHGIIPEPKIGLGIISAITLLIGYYAIFSARNKIDCRFAFLAYSACIYFYLYNYMRIMIAVAIIYVGFSCILREKTKAAYLMLMIAPLFHRSAIVVLCVFIVSQFFDRYRKTIIAIGCIGLIVFLSRPFFFLGLIRIERYSNQIINQGQAIGLGTTILILPFIFLLFLFKSRIEDKFVYNAAVYFTFANLAFSFLGYFVAPASRLSNMYFLFHLIFFVPYLIKNEKKMTQRKIYLITFFILYCALKYFIGAANFATMGIMPYY